MKNPTKMDVSITIPSIPTILQNPSRFSVQIRDPVDQSIVGTGIIISDQGYILTCEHVVYAAGVDPRLGQPCPSNDLEFILDRLYPRRRSNLVQETDAEVGIYFPKSREQEARYCTAKVKACFPENEDDIVLLKIENDLPLLSQDQIAQLGFAESSGGHKFRSYGFRRLENFLSGYATGEILGTVLTQRKLLLDPIQLHTRDVRPRMSGAGVLDEKLNLVVGLITERWNPGNSSENDNIAWAVDNHVLTFAPFSLKAAKKAVNSLETVNQIIQTK